MKKNLLLLIVLLGLNTGLFSQNIARETIYLKNGSVIKGYIIEQIPNLSIRVQTADGSIFVYKTDDIEWITKESTPWSYGRAYSPNSYLSKNYDITGSRGFIELGYTVGMGDLSLGRIELLISQGHQFSPYFYFGGGSGLNYYCTNGANDLIIPVFLDFRGNFIEGAVVPFVGLKAGYSFTTKKLGGMGVYIAPSVGVKFMTSEKNAINLSLSYTAQIGTIDYYDYRYSVVYSEKKNIGGLSIKVGYEF